MLRNRFVFVGILAIIFAIGGLIMTTTKIFTYTYSEAQAEELSKKLWSKVDQLTPEQETGLEQKIKAVEYLLSRKLS